MCETVRQSHRNKKFTISNFIEENHSVKQKEPQRAGKIKEYAISNANYN